MVRGKDPAFEEMPGQGKSGLEIMPVAGDTAKKARQCQHAAGELPGFPLRHGTA